MPEGDIEATVLALPVRCTRPRGVIFLAFKNAKGARESPFLNFDIEGRVPARRAKPPTRSWAAGGAGGGGGRGAKIIGYTQIL